MSKIKKIEKLEKDLEQLSQNLKVYREDLEKVSDMFKIYIEMNRPIFVINGSATVGGFPIGMDPGKENKDNKIKPIGFLRRK